MYDFVFKRDVWIEFSYYCIMLLIYVEQRSPRLDYVFDLFFNQLIATPYQLTTNFAAFEQFQEAKFSYSTKKKAEKLHLHAHTLLFEEGISEQSVAFIPYQHYQAPFAVPNSALPFDLFAAAFYLISRYEEYLPFLPDEHGRFRAEDSMAYRQGFLSIPVIEAWALTLKDTLLLHFPMLVFAEKSYAYLPTFDIDQAYLYREKTLFQKCKTFAKSVLQLRLDAAMLQLQVLLGVKKDPYDVYDQLIALHQQQELRIFFLLGDYGGNDCSLAPSNPAFQQLIQKVANTVQVGIHPSLLSNHKAALLKKEIGILQQLLKKTILHSRQHYLALSFPDTYRQLLKEGIQEEYSMGYASQVGFRASISSSFYWFDLAANQPTALRVHPFAVMDQTLRHYLRLSPAEGLMLCEVLIEEVKKVQGVFSTLWHNDSISDYNQWKGWKEMYLQLLDKAGSKDKIKVNILS